MISIKDFLRMVTVKIVHPYLYQVKMVKVVIMLHATIGKDLVMDNVLTALSLQELNLDLEERSIVLLISVMETRKFYRMVPVNTVQNRLFLHLTVKSVFCNNAQIIEDLMMMVTVWYLLVHMDKFTS